MAPPPGVPAGSGDLPLLRNLGVDVVVGANAAELQSTLAAFLAAGGEKRLVALFRAADREIVVVYAE